jgi:guanosine-3',5'-bis(diphosphate) 3'-pyrophosphohydrolase
MNTAVRPPCYEIFFAPLQVALNPTDYERVQFAYFASKYGHSGQLRADGTRYFDHPKAAAWIYIHEFGGRDPEVIIDTLLHDLSEDAYLLSPYRISLNFGEDRALDVWAMTKLPEGKETTLEYLGRIVARGICCILAKLFDRLHNLRTLHGKTTEKRKETIVETLEFHIPILIGALQKYGGPWNTIADQIEQKIHEAIAQY